MDDYKKNKPNWVPTEKDYRLIFRLVNGHWREITSNVPKYADLTLAEYLDMVRIDVPYGCTFMRLDNDYIAMEYRDFNSYVRIDVEPSKHPQPW